MSLRRVVLSASSVPRSDALAAGLLLLAVAGCDRPSPPPREPAAGSERQALLTNYIADDAGLLSASDRKHIGDRLREWERKTGHQMVVATVTHTQGQEIAAFTRDWANAHGIGRKGINDGVVLLISPNQQVARIAVGRGLEQRLPDSACQQIMDREIVPYFAQNQWLNGIDAGITAIIERVG